jgi:hypothetical protein
MAEHASPTDARNYLDFATASGYIQGFEKIEQPGKTLWKIKTLPTRYNTYHKLMDYESIVLTTREVMAFIEGVWAAAKIHPVHRAGDSIGPAARHTQAQRETQ